MAALMLLSVSRKHLSPDPFDDLLPADGSALLD
jgi:hypothetical protein